MNLAGKHYYHAVVWYYIGNTPKKALEDLYKALEYRPEHPGAIAMARKIGSKGRFQNVSLFRQSDIEEDAREMLYFLDVEARNRFFVAFLSREEINFIPSINWAKTMIFSNSKDL